MSHQGIEPGGEPLDPLKPEDEFDGHDDGQETSSGGRHSDQRGGRRRGMGGCLAVLVVLALLLGGLWWGLTKGIDYVQDRFADPEDYSGSGSGKVLVEIKQGDSAGDMGTTLKDADVVASVDAFRDAASARNEEFQGIQVGFYEMRKKMSADSALEILLDDANRVESSVAIPEGLRAEDMIDLVAKNTDFKRPALLRAARDVEALGLPSGVKVNRDGVPEGYFFPATYPVRPDSSAADLLKAMVTRWRQAAEDVDLSRAATRLGYTENELMVIASLIEAEGRGDDMPKVARVIYNRLEGPGDQGGTNGRLQIDASVNYALDRKLGVGLSSEDLQVDSPYNTYQNPGLPPTPIEAPGEEAMRAATTPADGPWYYYVTVNLRTGETKFSETYDDFLKDKAEFQQYCETSEAC